MKKASLVLCLLALQAYGLQCPCGNVWYVSPTGSGTDCSSGSPCALSTALNSATTPARPGDSIYLLGGLYKGANISSTLTGTINRPITVRSAPGQMARIDVNISTFLASPISASDTTITLVDGADFPSNTDVRVDAEVIQLKNKSGNTYTACVRARAGTDGGAASHAAGALVTRHQGSAITVNGNYVIWRDLEFFSSNPNRVIAITSTSYGNGRGGDAFDVQNGTHWFVNLVLHDLADGISNSGGLDTTFYGNLIFNCGWVGPSGDGGHGEGLYIETTSDPGDKPVVRDVKSWRNGDHGMKLYNSGDVNSHSKNGVFDGVISWDNGAAFSVQHSKDSREDGILVNANNPVLTLTVRNCVLNHYSGVGGRNAQFGVPTWATDTRVATITNNRFLGGAQGVQVEGWNQLAFTGNTVFIRERDSVSHNRWLVTHSRPGGSANTWHTNSYFNTSAFASPFKFGGDLNYATWQSNTGYDASGSNSSPSAPAEFTLVRPNFWEFGRCTIIHFDDTPGASIAVAAADLDSLLPNGFAYEIVDLDNYPHIIKTGTYTAGGGISITLPTGPVRQPIGFAPTIPRDTKFYVFELRAKGSPWGG